MLVAQPATVQQLCLAANPHLTARQAAKIVAPHTASAWQGGVLRRNLLLAGTAGVAGLASALRLADGGDEARLYSRGTADPYTAALDEFGLEQAASAAPPDLRILPTLGKARSSLACSLACVLGKAGRAPGRQPGMRAREGRAAGRVRALE